MTNPLDHHSLGSDPVHVLEELSGLMVYPRSLATVDGALFFMGRGEGVRKLGILADGVEPGFEVETRAIQLDGKPSLLSLGDLSPANAAALRARLPYTAPVRVGVRKSAGWGDRLGIATPGHVRAMKQAEAMVADQGIVPIYAQQSIREMERTARTPQHVIDDATWGVFQEGWRQGYGADADHLKTFGDIDVCVDAGFVMFTFDPRDHVDDAAETDSLETLWTKFGELPWERLESTPSQVLAAYVGQAWKLGPDDALTLSEAQLLRAAGKYGRAIAYIAELYRYLVVAMGDRPYEVEVSVDETETPTRPEEHLYIAAELKRLGVEWVSLAPRYVGRFEKGVDYIGDLQAFEADFARHVAIARALGPYKLSLHSGSDKFSVYPIAARLAGELVHLKTAGTSYLEALRAIAGIDPDLFREIYAFARQHYEHDKRSYHVSADMSRAPLPEAVAEQDLGGLLDQFDARQVFHVTFGTVLTTTEGDGGYLFRDRIYAALSSDEEAHYAALERHILRHITPFCRQA